MTAHKVLRAINYWPTLFRDSHACARNYKVFQMNAAIERRLAFPLQLVTVENNFEQWGLDVVGEISPNSLKLHKYILTTTDYFTRWTDTIPLKNVNDNKIIQFLEHNIITKFGVPNSLVFYNATYSLL